MDDKWRNDRSSFEIEWKKKIGKSMYPIASVIGVLVAVCFGYRIGVETGMVVFNYVIGAAIGSIYIFICDTIMDMFDIYFNYQSKFQQRVVNVWREYLFKRYPHIEKMYKDLWSLVEEIETKRRHLEELKIEEKELQTKIQEICNLLNSKKDELIELERECIDIISSNNITDEVERDTIINVNKGKTKVRRPNDN